MAERSELSIYLKAAKSLFQITVPVFEFGFKVAAKLCPPYRRRVEEQRAAFEAAEAAERLTARYNQLFEGLDPAAQTRFKDLSARCKIFCDPARLHGEESSTAKHVLDAQLGGVNRLLWVYLKLLHTRSTLDRFFFLQSSQPEEMAKVEAETRGRIDALPTKDYDDVVDKKRRSLEGTLATISVRRENLARARENYACIELELERIAATLTTLSELAVNCHDPSLITREVDAFTLSVETTEQTIGDLQAFTGFTAQDVIAPPILVAPRQPVRA
jgi:hypothetical protein